MGKARKHTPEQIVRVLRQIEVSTTNGKTATAAPQALTSWGYPEYRQQFNEDEFGLAVRYESSRPAIENVRAFWQVDARSERDKNSVLFHCKTYACGYGCLL